MRSKEVENSIKELTEITDLVKEEIKNNDENTTAILDIADLKNLDTLLNYTSEKEKENRFLRSENNIYKNETVSKSVIRNKMKDISNTNFNGRFLEYDKEDGNEIKKYILDKISEILD